MPSVSILIPAFKPQYLDLCISSALGQTMRDFELIVSDDSAGKDVEAIVAKWSDRRIRYVRNPTRGIPGSNRDFLVSIASGRYLKFLHDDDFLYPEAIERLAAMAERSDAALVFAWWHVVDEFGRLTSSITEAAAQGEERVFGDGEFFTEVVVKAVNFIGGPSNVLVEAEALRSITEPFGLEGVRMRFLTDVAMFTHLAHRGFKMASLGFFASAYRLHGGQYSTRPGPATSALLFEWELFLRWSLDRAQIDLDGYRDGTALQRNHYLSHVASYPELAPFIELDGRPGTNGRYLSEEFLDAVGRAHEEIDIRLATYGGRPEAATDSDALCMAELSAAREDVSRLDQMWRHSQSELANAEGELDRLRNTRTFRYTAGLRRLYSSFRHRRDTP